MNTSESWNSYRNIRNTYKSEINKSKSNYIKQKIRTAATQKQMWKEKKWLKRI